MTQRTPLHFTPTWNDPDRVEQLKLLWAEGLSASQIANRLRGVSRNAVIGKVHRLGLPRRATVSRRIGENRRPRMVRPAPGPKPASPLSELRRDGIPPPPPAVTDIPRVSFDDLEPSRHCRWPCVDRVADVPQHAPMFCGAAPVPGLPYCKAHSLRAFAPPQPRQRETFIPRDRNVREKETVGA